jgi:hypothetical protein
MACCPSLVEARHQQTQHTFVCFAQSCQSAEFQPIRSSFSQRLSCSPYEANQTDPNNTMQCFFFARVVANASAACSKKLQLEHLPAELRLNLNGWLSH